MANQDTIPVIFTNGKQGKASVRGMIVAWNCSCGHDAPIIGNLTDDFGEEIYCPKCSAKYLLSTTTPEIKPAQVVQKSR